MRLAALVMAGCLVAAEDPFSELAPRSAALVYAGPSTCGSAGMFGHVLLLLRGARGDVAVSYAAFVGEDGPFDLAWKALIDAYPAGYEITPWAETQRVYARDEGRPIWVMELGLAPGDLRRLLDRLAADLPSRRPYRLFRDNCASGIADLLDAVQPGTRARLAWWQLPADVTRAAHDAGIIDDGRPLSAGDRSSPVPYQLPVPWSIGIAGGSEAGRGYLGLSLRSAWHCWDDPPNGTGVGEGCELLGADLRWYDDDHAPVVVATTLIAVDALSPPGRAAWQMAAGSRRSGGVQRGELVSGYGLGWAPDRDTAAFALASLRAAAGMDDGLACSGVDAGLRLRRGSALAEARLVSRWGWGAVRHERIASLSGTYLIDTTLVLTTRAAAVVEDAVDAVEFGLAVRWLPRL